MGKNFWKAYIMFFIFIFPMIFEYLPMIGLDSDDMFYYSSPKSSLIYLGVGMLAWIWFILSYYRLYIRPTRRSSLKAAQILKKGIATMAKIERKKLIKDYGAYETLELLLSLKNFAGITIHIPYEINDGNPTARRFEKGNDLPLKISTALDPPVFLPANAQLNDSYKLILKAYMPLIILVLFCIGYLIFSYWLQNNGVGWRFLHFWHPWVTIPMWGLFFGVFLEHLISRIAGDEDGFLRGVFGVLGLTGKNTRKEIKILFNGKVAIAEIVKMSQTGVYINEQPQVVIDLEYIGQNNQIYNVRKKEIISLLELGAAQKTQRPIMYLPEEPLEVIFAEQYLPAGL